MNKHYVGDFESTTDENNCYVWGWALCNVDDLSEIILGYSLDDFMEFCKKMDGNPTISMHNLKWDISFILYWLFHNDYHHVSSKERGSGTFTTVINGKGMVYKLEVVFYLKGKRVNKVTFIDSYKLLPMSVEKIAETLKLPFKKLEMDYDARNGVPIGTPFTEAEKEYIIHDVKIVAAALQYFKSMGLNRLTIGSCALFEYKNIIGKNTFKRWFP